MNPLALAALGIQTEPVLSDKWAALFGTIEQTDESVDVENLPPCPASFFGLHLQTGYWKLRSELRLWRQAIMIQYLRKNPRLTTEALAKVFGLPKTCVYQDLKIMAKEGRVKHGPKAPYLWRAA